MDLCELKPCKMCLNARVDADLTDENDFSFCLVGESGDGFRIGIQSGYGQPVAILFEQLMMDKEWHLIGDYEPNFCPNCGRPLTEYDTLKSVAPPKSDNGRAGEYGRKEVYL